MTKDALPSPLVNSTPADCGEGNVQASLRNTVHPLPKESRRKNSTDSLRKIKPSNPSNTSHDTIEKLVEKQSYNSRTKNIYNLKRKPSSKINIHGSITRNVR